MIFDFPGAIAYIAMAAAVSALAASTEGSAIWRQRHILLGIMGLGAVCQTGLGICDNLGDPAAACWLRGVSSCCLLALPLGFWPVMRRLRHGQLHVVNRRLMRRAERAEAAAAAAQRWLQMAEQAGHVGHWQVTVPDYRLIWSDEVFRIHGLWREHFIPRLETALAAFHPVDGQRVGDLLQQCVSSRTNFDVAARLRRPDGDIRHVILRAGPVLDASGAVTAVNGVMVDVTEPKRAEAKLQPHIAGGETLLEDEVTGLADRKQFDLSLAYEFKRAVRSRKPLGMVLLEIDHFERFREVYGAMKADECLRLVAQAVQAIPRRTGDVVTRYDATQIAVLLPLADGPGAMRVAQAIAEAIRSMGLAHSVAPSGQVTVSCGAAAFIGMDDLYNPLELTRRATRAPGDAIAMGGDRVRGFNATQFLETLAGRG